MTTRAPLDRFKYSSSAGRYPRTTVAAPAIGLITALVSLTLILVLILAASAGNNGASGDGTPHPQPGTAPAPHATDRR